MYIVSSRFLSIPEPSTLNHSVSVKLQVIFMSGYSPSPLVTASEYMHGGFGGAIVRASAFHL